MRFDVLHRGITYLLATLGLLALNLGGELSFPVRVLMALGLVGSWFTPRTWLRHPQYSAAWTYTLVGVVLLQILRGFGSDQPLILVLEFAGILQISRLFHRRSARDHQHIQGIAFVHLISATVLSSSINYGLIFFGFVLALPWMLALTHLRTEVELSYRAPGEALEGIPPEEVDVALRSRKLAGFGFLAATGALAMPLFLVTAAFFLLFPRVGMGFLNFGGPGGRQVAGFGANVDLGGFGTIRSDPTTVLRIYPEELPATPPPRRTFRLRGTAFDRFVGGSWEYTGAPGRRLEPRTGMDYFGLIDRYAPPSATTRFDIDLDPLGEAVVFLPPRAASVQIAPRTSGARPHPRALFLRSDGDLRYQDLDGIGLRYSVTAFDASEPPERADLSAEERARYLQLPADLDPRIAELAGRMAGDGSNSSKAARLEAWLKMSGDFRYTLEQLNGQAEDHLVSFLLETQAGHCEYFSTALAIMLRTQGIPTRNVTGFVGGAFNPFGRYYAVRQGDAHSWVEAHVDNHWITLDPTPPGAAQLAPSASGFMYTLRSFVDSIRASWDRDVVGYDMNTQMSVLRRIYREMRRRGWWGGGGGGGGGGDSPDEESEEDMLGGAGGGLGTFVAGAIIVAILLGLLVFGLVRRRRGAGVALAEHAAEARRFWGRVDTAAGRAGLGRAGGMTVREQCQLFVDAGVDEELVWGAHEAYVAARFGERALEPDDRVLLENLRADLARLERREAA